MNSEAIRVLSSSFDVGWDPSDYDVDAGGDSEEIVGEFRRLVSYLQLPAAGHHEEDVQPLVDKFLAGNGLVQVLLGPHDKKLCHQLVNLHDLWANALMQNSVLHVNHFGIGSGQVLKKNCRIFEFSQ